MANLRYKSSPTDIADGDLGDGLLDIKGRQIVVPVGGTGTSSNQLQGTAADNAPAVGNPVLVGGEYNSSTQTYADGDAATLQMDASGNAKVTQGTRLDALNDRVTSFVKAHPPVNLTASGQILSGPGIIEGFYVNSTSSGTIVLRDALTATTPVISGTITPAVGFHRFPAELAVGGYASLGGTIDVTFFTRLTPTTGS